MSVHLDLVNAVNFASIHQAALHVDVKKAFSWTLMEEDAWVSLDKCSDLNTIVVVVAFSAPKQLGKVLLCFLSRGDWMPRKCCLLSTCPNLYFTARTKPLHDVLCYHFQIRTCFHLGSVKEIWLFHVSLMVARLVLTFSLQSHSLELLKWQFMWV